MRGWYLVHGRTDTNSSTARGGTEVPGNWLGRQLNGEMKCPVDGKLQLDMVVTEVC